jgi:hypothetical protein
MIELAEKIKALNLNIKAESVIEDLIMNGLDPDRVLIEFRTSHKKNWDHDILSCDAIGQDLVFKLSRDGLFQSLPEYLFLLHPEDREYDKVSLKEFNRQQENNARIFFHPIENEIFNQSVALENQENHILSVLTTHGFRNLTAFWKIDTDIGKRIYTRLSKLMPYLHSVIGNFTLTARCLEFLIEEHVEWKMEERIHHIDYSHDDSIKSMNECECGEDLFTCGDYVISTSTIVFTIGPIENIEIGKFISNGSKRNLLNIFENYFIPLELEADYIFTIQDSDQDFFMDQSFLGFNTTIN